MTILVTGLSVLDLVFTLEELPRAAEKYRASDLTVTGGGCAANAAVAIARLGGAAVLVSPLGDDSVADELEADLLREGVDCRFLERCPGARSSTSAVFVDSDGNRQIVNYRDESLGADSAWIEQLWIEAIDDVGFDAVLVDTRWAAGAVAAIRHARERGVPAVLDAEAPVSCEAAELSTHVVFSEQGLRRFTGIDDTATALLVADRKLPGWVAVTIGAGGTLIADGASITRIGAPEIVAVDTTGAGDVWHGAFTFALCEGLAEATSVRFANAAAATKCESAGGRAGAPSLPEVEATLSGEWG